MRTRRSQVQACGQVFSHAKSEFLHLILLRSFQYIIVINDLCTCLDLYILFLLLFRE